MKVLMKATDYLSKEEMSGKESAVQSLVCIVKDAYQESTSASSEAYIADEYVDASCCTFGADSPDTIVKEAESWNADIAGNLARAISKVIERCGGYDALVAGFPGGIPFGVPELYSLKEAAIAADGTFYLYADKILYLDGGSGLPYFHSLLSVKGLAEIQAHPEEYAILDVPAK